MELSVLCHRFHGDFWQSGKTISRSSPSTGFFISRATRFCNNNNNNIQSCLTSTFGFHHLQSQFIDFSAQIVPHLLSFVKTFSAKLENITTRFFCFVRRLHHSLKCFACECEQAAAAAK